MTECTYAKEATNLRPQFQLGILLFGWLLAGCNTTTPLEEIRLFESSHKSLTEASQPMLDDLALAERRQGRTVAVKRAKEAAQGEGDMERTHVWASTEELGFIKGFYIVDSHYYSEITDPPATAAFRNGLSIVGSYIEVLLVLAEGRNIDEAVAQVNSLQENIVGLLTLLPSTSAAGGFLKPTLDAMTPLLEKAASANNAKELERVVIEGGSVVSDLIGNLKAAADEIFNTLVESPVAQFDGEGMNDPRVARHAVQTIELYRVLVSDYVVLLDELQEAFNKLLDTYKRPRNAVTLASLAATTVELSAHAESWRKTLSTLRASAMEPPVDQDQVPTNNELSTEALLRALSARLKVNPLQFGDTP